MSDPNEYTVGWICAVATEYVAAQEFLDEEHPKLASQDANDNNIYTLGSIGQHKIVIACLPHWNYGLVSAAHVARDMLRTFTNVRFGLMVGIGGGAPTTRDIRLGDIVVSSVDYDNGAVFQYDFGQTVQKKTFKTTGYQDTPPVLLQAAVQELKVKYRRHGNQIDKAIAAVLDRNPRLQEEYRRPNPATDRLYRSNFVHVGTSNESCASSCGLDDANLVIRRPRSQYEDDSEIHYGLIASGNQLIQNAVLRDRLAKQKGVLCFEMEAAGLMNYFKCLVIRGICDYSDSHKNEHWQGYAAMAAAAYAKDLLNTIIPSKVEAEKKIIELSSEIRKTVQGIENEVKTIQVDARFDKVMNWLSPPDPSTNFNIARELRHQRSGQWLLDSDTYSAWKAEPNSFLWLNGIAGCGKTILSSIVVADLEQANDLTLLYFYFDFSNVDKQLFEKAVRSFINQLYHKKGDCRTELDSLYDSCLKGRQQPSNERLRMLLQNLIQKAGEVWIVLDALDEHEEQSRAKGLLPWIKDLRDCTSNTHILVTSRPEADIKHAVKEWACEKQVITLKSDAVNKDIHEYVEAMVTKMPRWQSRRNIQEEIKDALTKKADGMFRWVSFQLDMLEHCLDAIQVRDALASLPRNLEEMYARSLKRVRPEYKHFATRLLQFLTYSERPLRIEEVVDALAVNIASKPRFDPEYRMPIPEEITRYCPGFVILVKRDSRRNAETVIEVQLAHFSVKEYLTSNRLEPDMAKDFGMIPAMVAMTEVCLSCLLDLDYFYSPDIDFNTLVQGLSSRYLMATFSSQYWMDYAAVVESSNTEILLPVEEYLSSERAYKLGFLLNSPDDYWDDIMGIKNLSGPLYYASFRGLSRSVKVLLNSADVNAEGGWYGNSLQAASFKGHEKIVEMLLGEGADVNAQGGQFGNALHAASYIGDEKIVEMLLGKGANVNAQGGRYGSALLAAVYIGHDKIVKLLLAKGADVNAKDKDGKDALQIASYRGHEKIIVLLTNLYPSDRLMALAESVESTDSTDGNGDVGNTGKRKAEVTARGSSKRRMPTGSPRREDTSEQS